MVVADPVSRISIFVVVTTCVSMFMCAWPSFRVNRWAFRFGVWAVTVLFMQYSITHFGYNGSAQGALEISYVVSFVLIITYVCIPATVYAAAGSFFISILTNKSHSTAEDTISYATIISLALPAIIGFAVIEAALYFSGTQIVMSVMHSLIIVDAFLFGLLYLIRNNFEEAADGLNEYHPSSWPWYFAYVILVTCRIAYAVLMDKRKGVEIEYNEIAQA